jgi:hypothetical protein
MRAVTELSVGADERIARALPLPASTPRGLQHDRI